MGIKKCQQGLRSVDLDRVCADESGEKYEPQPQCVIDVCSGFWSNSNHGGWAKCALIFILRKYICSLLPSGI